MTTRVLSDLGGVSVGESGSDQIWRFTSASNFTPRNQLIDARAATISGGKLADLALGKKVHAIGLVVRNVLKATTLEFD